MKEKMKTYGLYAHLLNDRCFLVRDIYLFKENNNTYIPKKEITTKTKAFKLNTFPNHIL